MAENRAPRKFGDYAAWGRWLGVGAAIGVGMGLVMGNLAGGIGIGIALGIALAMTFQAAPGEDEKKP